MRSLMKRSCSKLRRTYRLKKKKRPSTVAPELLLPPQEDFFILVANGDVAKLKLFISRHSEGDNLNFDVNIVNYENDNAMSIAVNAGDMEMIKYLLTLMKVSKKRVLLNAINRRNVELVQFLCEVMCADVEVEEEMDDGVGESEFPPHMQPLMLAAIVGHLEIVSYLIGRGHGIAEPHVPGCSCNFCIKLAEQWTPLTAAQHQYDKYRALASPEFIVHTTADPIYYSFALHKLLKKMVYVEQAFNMQYEELCTNLRCFAAALVEQCESTKEVGIVLNQRRPWVGIENFLQDMSETIFPRLALAFEYKQKEFVTSVAVQSFVERHFHGFFRDYRYYRGLPKALFPLVRIFTVPSLLFTVIFYRTSELARFYSAPINRMLHFFATYLIFLFAIFMESTRDKEPERYPYMASPWTWVIFLYFLGFTAAVVHQVLYIHPLRFISTFWNMYDVVMLTMYSFYLSSSIAVFLYNGNPLLYLQKRTSWQSLDPELLAEGVLVIANIMAFVKLFHFLLAYVYTGMLLVAIGRSLKYCMKFSLYAIAILLVYSTAYSKFYSYYAGMQYKDPITGDVSTQEDSFIDWTRSFKTFFWTMLKQTDPSLADVVLAREFLSFKPDESKIVSRRKTNRISFKPVARTVVSGLPEVVHLKGNASHLRSILRMIMKVGGNLGTDSEKLTMQDLENQLHIAGSNSSYLVLGVMNNTIGNWSGTAKDQQATFIALGTIGNALKNHTIQNMKSQPHSPANDSLHVDLDAMNKTQTNWTAPAIKGRQATYVVLGTVSNSRVVPGAIQIVDSARNMTYIVVGDVNKTNSGLEQDYREIFAQIVNETSLVQNTSSHENKSNEAFSTEKAVSQNGKSNQSLTVASMKVNCTEKVPVNGKISGSTSQQNKSLTREFDNPTSVNYPSTKPGTDNMVTSDAVKLKGTKASLSTRILEVSNTTLEASTTSEAPSSTKLSKSSAHQRPQKPPGYANEYVKVVTKGKSELTRDHTFTQVVGYFGLGSFCTLMIFIVLNIIVAVICKTYTHFQDDVAERWLYVRTQIYYYFMVFPIFPPPFNLIPHGYTKMERQYEADLERKRQCRRKHHDCDYWALMKVLVTRYYKRKWMKSCRGKTLNVNATFFPAAGARKLNLHCEDAVATTQEPA